MLSKIKMLSVSLLSLGILGFNSTTANARTQSCVWEAVKYDKEPSFKPYGTGQILKLVINGNVANFNGSDYVFSHQDKKTNAIYARTEKGIRWHLALTPQPGGRTMVALVDNVSFITFAGMCQ